MTPEEFRARFMASRGLSLDSAPLPVSAPQTRAVTGTGLPGDTPYVTPTPGAVDKWRSGVAQDMSAGVIPTPSAAPVIPPPAPVVPPQQFPDRTSPVPYAPPGVSLTSTPADTPQTGWAGTVGQTEAPAPAAIGGPNYDKLMAGLEDVAKGLKPKVQQDSGAATITPMVSQPNQANQAAAQLMTAMLNKPRGFTLTGR